LEEQGRKRKGSGNMHKTSAWPLSLAYIGLIVYASLYPFTDVRDQGIVPWAFVTAPFPPKYWTWFDVISNFLGYMPLGALLALSALRTGRGRYAVLVASLAGCLLSLSMETLQSYLPQRVPSNLDWATNSAGTLVGAVFAALLERFGAIDHWSRFRARWFVREARGGLVLLALWPVGLLFPPAVPLGLGQVYERLEAAVADALEGTPFLEWLPVRDVELQPLLPISELSCVLLSALVPCLLGYCIISSRPRRAAFALAALAVGVATSALSAALSYGPMHAWAWFDLPSEVGLVAALVLALALVPLPRRAAAGLVLLALGVDLSLLNQASASAYFSQALQSWEQGRFIHFYGVAQWVGWLWPYGALVYAMLEVSSSEAKT
jgi:VanZ family protein